MHSDSEIVAEFIGYHQMALDTEMVLRRQGASWGPEIFSELAYDDPTRCWQIAKAISQSALPDDAMISLSVTLGTLLREHPEIIDTVAHDVREDQRLAKVMSWIEEDEYILPEIWAKVLAMSATEP